MKKYFAFLLMILPLLCGCEYEFELDDLQEDDKLSVVGVVNQDGVLYLNVETAAPVNKYTKGKKADNTIEVLELSVNGQDRRLVKVDSLYSSGNNDDWSYWGSPLSSYRFWKTDVKINPGDEVSIRAKSVTTKEASASFPMPEKPVIKSLDGSVFSYEIDNISGADFFDTDASLMSFDLEIGGASEDEFYGLQLVNASHYDALYETGEHEVNDYTEYLKINDLASETSAVGYTSNVFFVASYDGFTASNRTWGISLHMFSGKSLENGHIKFTSYYYPSGVTSGTRTYWVEGDDENGPQHYDIDYTLTTESRYKVLLYKVSPALYHYCKSLYMIDNNYFAEVGLSPSNFSYTNIAGGFGVLGGLTVTESDWIPSPEEKK